MIFKEQMEIKESISSYSLSNSNKMLKVESSEDLLKVYNDDINVMFDNSNGDLISYVVNDKEFIDKAPYLNFWRAPIDNDYGNNLPLRSKEWKVASNKRVLRNINHELLDKNIKVTVNYSLANLKSYYTTTFLINPEGELRISNDFNYKGNLKDAEMPRFGMNFQIPKSYNNVSWYGRGPHENYVDRMDSAFMGVYSSSVSDLGFDYSRPQENGYRTQTKWLELIDDSGNGFKIFGDPYISFSAHYNTIEDFDDGVRDKKPGEMGSARKRMIKKQRKPIEIPKRNFISLNIDLKQMGVGGDNSWGARPLLKYIIPPGNYKYSFIIKPISN